MLKIGTLLTFSDKRSPYQGHVDSSDTLIVVKIDHDKDSFLTVSRLGLMWWPFNYVNYILMIEE